MSVDNVVAVPRHRTYRAGWGWLLLSTAARFYLVFLGALTACALAPMLFGLTGSVVQSGSMEPHISTGDVVLSRPLAADAPTPMGRVITFQAPTGSATSDPVPHRLVAASKDGTRLTAGGGLVLHRLVAANKDGTLVTAGDANPSPDSTPISRSDIISMGCLLIPWIGLPSIWVRTGAFLQLGIWLLLTVCAVAIAAADASSRRPPSATPPDDADVEAGPGPDPEPYDAANLSGPPRESISALLSWAIPVVRVGAGSAAVALVAVFTVFALAVAPLGAASAAFTARAATTGNSWTTAGPATRLAFTTDPSDSGGAIAFDVQPVVVVLAANGHIVDVSSAPVTLSLTTPAGATLTCTTNPMPAIAGIATFAGCAVDDTGTYRLTATSGTLTSDVSAPFTITTSSATSLAFTTDPSNSTGGIAFGTQPVVTVKDAGGNTVTTSTAPVTLTITAAAGATLTCTANPTAAVAGVATFAGCTIDTPGTYTLTATASGLTGAVSAGFTIAVGSTSTLSFTTDPSSSTGGTAFATQPVVAIQDDHGNTVTSSTARVTLVLTTPGTATLTCTENPEAAVSGVATFAGCIVDKPGMYTLTAASPGLTSAVSTSFTITVGPATKLAFTTSPSNALPNTTIATQPVVTVQDAGGNTVTTSGPSVTLVITPPTGGAALTNCAANPRITSSGVATFSGCRVSIAGTYTLTATSGTLTSAVSASFIVTTGAVKLAFTRSPSTITAAGSTFGTQPRVTVQNPAGSTVTSPVKAITLTLTPPTGGATLTCTSNPRNTSAGVATFSGCRVDTPGVYTLTATSTGLTSAVSATFTITGAPSKLAFTTSPSASTGGTAFATQPVVAVQASNGGPTSGTNTVALSITTPAGASLSCTSNPRAASAGVAAFAGCRIDKAGTYTLTATASGLSSAVSASFSVTVGPANELGFTTNPSNSTGGTAFATQPVVTVQDAGGNTVTASTASVDLGITTAAGATLTCTEDPKTAEAGVATFAGCRIDRNSTYTLTAVSSGLTNAVSSTFTISVGPASKLAFTTQPSGAARNIAFATQPWVTVQDAGGNTVTTSGPSVTLVITPPTGGAVLTCTANPRSTSSGVAIFAGCRISTAGTYTLTATSGTLAATESNALTIS